jgi:hypothetical protein
MKLLVTGIPGTGKTSIGHYLQSEKGFQHFDMEAALKSDLQIGAAKAEEFINASGNNKVITWGFRTVEDAPMVKRLQSLGYTMIWLDGDRDAARRACLKRGDTNEELFDLQLSNIDKMDLEGFKAITINPFDASGNFLKKEEIADKILQVNSTP